MLVSASHVPGHDKHLAGHSGKLLHLAKQVCCLAMLRQLDFFFFTGAVLSVFLFAF